MVDASSWRELVRLSVCLGQDLPAASRVICGVTRAWHSLAAGLEVTGVVI